MIKGQTFCNDRFSEVMKKIFYYFLNVSHECCSLECSTYSHDEIENSTEVELSLENLQSVPARLEHLKADV